MSSLFVVYMGKYTRIETKKNPTTIEVIGFFVLK